MTWIFQIQWDAIGPVKREKQIPSMRGSVKKLAH